MSGIGGLLRLDGAPAARPDVERMLDRLAHRGPDAAGVWCVGTVGLGHRLLHTTPESLRERQPLTSATSDLVLTADARIDNRAELCSVLLAPADVTDAELILRAYERWGERSPEHLLGDFAFAIRDARRDVLFCARDHLGVKPFYYHHAPGRLFCFASEIKGLLALPDVPRRLNETRVADYLVPLLEDKVITFYEEIVRLPPAHRMTVSRDAVRIEEYWALDPEREIRMKSDEEYAEAFREIFTEAVHCRLRSAFPVGSMLSGGLDSSSIVCVARKQLSEEGRGPLHTFSAIFPDLPECDEREYIDAVLAEGGVKQVYVHGDKLSPLANLDAMLGCQDEPFYAPNLYLHWALYDAAKQAGMRILLDGIDGDTTVSHSLLLLADLTRAGHWRQLAAEAGALSRNLGQPAWRVVWNWGVKPLAPHTFRRAWRALRGRDGPVSRVNPLIRETFARSKTVAPRLEAMLKQRRTAGTAREDHLQHLASGLVPFVLEVADRAAAAFGLEPRYPFFDRRAAEFCLALPARQKLRLGWTRFVLRHAMTGLLPAKLQWRSTKTDLAPGFTRGLITSDRMLLQRLRHETSQSLGEYVDQRVLRRACDLALESGTPEAVFTLWPPLTLALWLRYRGGNGSSVGATFTKSEEAPAMEPTTIATPGTTTSNTEPKRSYATPELTVHGSVEKITGNIGTKGSDGLTGSTIG